MFTSRSAAPLGWAPATRRGQAARRCPLWTPRSPLPPNASASPTSRPSIDDTSASCAHAIRGHSRAPAFPVGSEIVVTRPGQLISANCTTGWLDWTPGALWLLPDGLLRARRERATVRERDDLRIDPTRPVIRAFAEDEPERIGSQRKRSVWVRADQITAATVRRGLPTNGTVLRLRDESCVKLLWMRRDRAEQPLIDALARWGVPTTFGSDSRRQ